MMQKTKKPYMKPTVKEHGVVRELTQSGTGGRMGMVPPITKSKGH